MVDENVISSNLEEDWGYDPTKAGKVPLSIVVVKGNKPNETMINFLYDPNMEVSELLILSYCFNKNQFIQVFRKYIIY